MTHHYPDGFDDDDRMLHDSLAPLRDIKPTAASKAEINPGTTPAETRAGGEGLHASDSGRPSDSGRLRWLLSIAASLLVGTAIGWTMRGSHGETNAPLSRADTSIIAATVRIPVRSTATIESTQPTDATPSYYTEELYLCGIGVVQSNSSYYFAKETR